MLDADFLASSAQSEIAALASHIIVVNGALRVPAIMRKDFVSAFGVETNRPNATVADLDYPAPAHDDVIDLEDGARYRVKGVQPDGAGMTVLLLERQA